MGEEFVEAGSDRVDGQDDDAAAHVRGDGGESGDFARKPGENLPGSAESAPDRHRLA
ncbi:hypothetical protein SDC9_169981 [bioreactor metagenome]|uniref:Uncharacterized protein n=1 Tax=bioreactor metagenome TaxID=1076179 RepID=A0A645G6U2_9ZZZZ